ncbi:hypothetical protein NEUTE2DRAFT_154452 [Neurospora tetrasperma FGSC 2509]|nr:hypothetical protein NEUTE2DRAFT_154452 [Neurospora tetrasperma FGSC 2509]
MAKPTPLSAAKISLAAFNEVLGRYPACIQAISQNKGAKPGQKTLTELDEYRYGEAVTAFGPEKADTKSIGVDEVKTLVEWKLYVLFHILIPATYPDIPGTLKGVTYRLASLVFGGRRATAIFSGLQTPSLKLTSDAPTGPLVSKITERSTYLPSFRPTLMKLVSSNDPDLVQTTVHDAVKQYRDKSDISGALGILTKLKGIGPATASLLLAVHDPDNVIFFADEAYYWLCGDGKKVPLKYNVKEYNSLCQRSRALSQRLGVKAIDIERVAFVLMRQESGNVAAASATLDPEPSVSSVAKVTPPKTKRKTVDNDTNDPEPPVRRSKRTKHSFESVKYGK